MSKFNEAYYITIWGTVHRHDYCKDRANWFVHRYGKCKILDIGTGCGFFVKTLRELGCDAWGLDISEYAFANSCCKEYVQLGSALNMPFADDSFDLVVSNGVFGYDPDVKAMWHECLRVGKLQNHNIDYDDADPDHQYEVIKSKEWWDAQLC